MNAEISHWEMGKAQCDEIIDYIVKNQLGQKIELKGGDILYHQQEPAQFVYFLFSGKLQVSHLVPDGKQFIQRIFPKNSVIGLVPLLLQDTHMSACQAVNEATLRALNSKQFQSLLAEKPEFGQLFMHGLAVSVRYYSWTSRILSEGGIRARVLNCLKRAAFEYGVPAEDGTIVLDIVLTQEDMAEMVCCSRQQLSSQLNKLKSQGLVSLHNRKITINKPWF